MIVAAKLLLVGFAAGSVMSPPSAPYGIGWADATCPLAGRTLSEDVYTRTYVRSCTWTWDAGKETRMQLAQGLDDGPATNVYIHFKAAGRCSNEEWYRRVVLGHERRAICQHRGGQAKPV